MSAFDPPPSCFDPEWLSRQTLESIRREGSDPSNVEWVRRLYAWIYSRSPEREAWPPPTAQPEAPPCGFFPVLLAANDGREGRISFLSISYLPRLVENHVSASSTEAAANRALEWARTYLQSEQLRGNDQNAFYARVTRPNVDGDSDGLAAFLFILIQNMSPSRIDDLCATGTWNAERNCFEPVAEFAAKVKAAEQWGYRRLLYAAGQDGAEDIKTNLQLIAVPNDPQLAAKAIRNVVDPLPQRLRRSFKVWLVAGLFAVVLFGITHSKLAEYATIFAAIVIGLGFIDTIHSAINARKPIREVITPLLGITAASCLVLVLLREILNVPSPQLGNWFTVNFIGLLCIGGIQWIWNQIRCV